MSGGSYNYAYARVDDILDDFESMVGDFARECLERSSSPLRTAFSAHLLSLLERPDLWRIIRSPHWEKVTTAMHDIEWVDSSDYLRGDEDEAIRACLADFESMLKKKKEEEKK